MRYRSLGKPLVSIVMAVKDGQQYLSASIDSILHQSFQDFEFIIIDDGSTDGTSGILQSYAREDSRIQVLTRGSRGLTASLNEGLEFSRGNWVARMDADDVALPDRLSRQLHWLDQTQAEVCGGWMKTFGKGELPRLRRYPVTDDAIKLQLSFRTAFSHPTMIMSRKLLSQFRYNEALPYGQDYDLWTRLAMTGAKMTNLPRVVLKYRIHPHQISSLNNDKQIAVKKQAQKKYLAQMIDYPNDLEILEKFAPPGVPSIEDARSLRELFLSVTWASRIVKLQIYTLALRFVRPAGLSVFSEYNHMRRTLGLSYSRQAVPLAIQSMLRASPDTQLFKAIKKFV